jgi:hypothetical protein
VKRRQSFSKRGQLAGKLGALPAVLAIAGAVAVGLSGCSPGADYPSIFPAIHDMPPPRDDATMNSDQVQQATEDLITDRNHLNAEAQGNGQASASPSVAAKPATAKKKIAAQSPAANGGATTAPAAAANGTQTAGAESK